MEACKIESYEEYKNKFLTFFTVQRTPYEGYISNVSSGNVASLRVCVLTEMSPKLVSEYRMIQFSFSPKISNEEDSEENFLRELVDRLISKEKGVRVHAYEEFCERYLFKES